MKTNLFVVESESFMVNLVSERLRSFLSEVIYEEAILFDPSNNPDHQAFSDFNFSMLKQSQWSIPYDSNYTFLSGIPYDLARSIFGSGVSKASSTAHIIYTMLVDKYKVNTDDFNYIIETIQTLLDGDIKIQTKNDIDQLLSDVYQLVKIEQKNINCCDQLILMENCL